jgi:ribokinase
VRRAPRLLVIGHVEWVECVRGDPPRAVWRGAAGAAVGAAATAGHLGADVDLLCTVGGDALAAAARDSLASLPLRAHVVGRDAVQRRVEVAIDGAGERTLRLIGEKLPVRGVDPLPWELVDAAAAVFAVAADAAALRRARAAPLLVSTARWLPTLRTSGVRLDVLLASGADADERYAAGDLAPPPDAVVTTRGAAGGELRSGSDPPAPYLPSVAPGPVRSTYGAGDAFAGGAMAALAAGEPLARALVAGSRAGAAALVSFGPYPWLENRPQA